MYVLLLVFNIYLGYRKHDLQGQLNTVSRRCIVSRCLLQNVSTTVMKIKHKTRAEINTNRNNDKGNHIAKCRQWRWSDRSPTTPMVFSLFTLGDLATSLFLLSLPANYLLFTFIIQGAKKMYWMTTTLEDYFHLFRVLIKASFWCFLKIHPIHFDII